MSVGLLKIVQDNNMMVQEVKYDKEAIMGKIGFIHMLLNDIVDDDTATQIEKMNRIKWHMIDIGQWVKELEE